MRPSSLPIRKLATRAFGPALAGRGGVALTGCLLGAVAAQAQMQREADWTRHLRLGLQMGVHLQAKFSSEGQFGVSGSQAGSAGVAAQDHSYDDGYVRVDDTGNAGGYTSNWGYQAASQYDSATGQLTFHSASGYTGGNRSSAQDAPYYGADMAYGGILKRWDRARLMWDFGFGYLPADIQDRSSFSTQFIRTVHRYDTGGIAMPGAPYSGGAGGVGPTIKDVATALPGDAVQGSVEATRQLEADLYALRLGPMFQYELSRRWAIQAGAGFLFGIVDGEYRYSERITLADGSATTNSGEVGSTDLKYGAYGELLVLFKTNEPADIYLGVQYQWLGSYELSRSGHSASLDLESGVSIVAGINWPF